MASVLTVTGVAFLGAVTATLSSWLVSRRKPTDDGPAAVPDPQEPPHNEIARRYALLAEHGIARDTEPERMGP